MWEKCRTLHVTTSTDAEAGTLPGGAAPGRC